MDTTIRNIDENAYRAIRARAVLEGRTDSALAVAARRRAEGQIVTFDQEFRKVRGLHVFPE